MEFFNRLGSLVAQRWQARNYNESVFPEIAAKALCDMPPSQLVSCGDVIAWSFSHEPMPEQVDMDAHFGQPPVTVYQGCEFRIEVLFWTEGTPEIHQHAFSGAFHVMEGSSLHSIWDFEKRYVVNNRLFLGRMALGRAELLTKGDTRRICGGRELIHATFHLERPSISIVVRTIQEKDKLPQYSYLFPSIAYDAERIPAPILRRTQLALMLMSAGRHDEFEECLRYILDSADAYSTFIHLLHICKSLGVDDRETLLLAARIRHPDLLEALEPALVHLRRREKILRLRRATTVPELQYFLALLLNVPDRDEIVRLITARYPTLDPVESICEWVNGLSKSGMLGVRFPKSWLLLLRLLLSELTESEMESHFIHRLTSDGVETSKSDFEELHAALKNYWLLKPLFGKCGLNDRSLSQRVQ